MTHSFANEKFADIERQIEETLWCLKGTKDQMFRIALLRKIRLLLDNADLVLESPPTEADPGTKQSVN
jgi:hypothetical protein